MAKICDNTSVGMLVWQNGQLLLIERKRPPFGFAPPAGHVDGDASFELAAIRELEEEVGLKTKNLQLLIEGRKNNLCRREKGTWHYWKIYKVEAEGEIKPSKDETKQVDWYTQSQIAELAKGTEDYLAEKIPEDEWQKYPGLQPIWYEWFCELNLL